MRKLNALFALLFLFLIPSTSHPFNLTLTNTPTQIYFSPNGGSTEAIIQEIGKTKKVMIIDQETVITGSFNFTRAAEEKNAENLLIIKSKELAKIYIDNWNTHKGHSEPYQARY